MELRQLQYFVAVVEEGGFTRAATRLHLAQPGVSAQIRRLERELGQPLLDRTGRTVRLTPVGAAVLPQARAALAAAAAVRETADAHTGLLRGQVTLGLVTGAAERAFDIPGLLADFHAAHPHVEIALTEDSSERMLTALRQGDLDLAAVGVADADPPAGLTYEILVDDPLVAAVHPDDPLARRGRLPLDVLDGRRLISLPHGTGVRAVLERACAGAGFRPHIAFEAGAPLVLARFAARGLGVAVLPEISAAQADEIGVRVLPFEDPALRARVALTWRSAGPPSPAAAALLDLLRAALVPGAGG
ncbi:LysR family transcriptional regulator [Streptomyces xanthii]|uniref:LysR family transcriptional regulator n=1 Tax=Streptomyces xanthii TaxID=2768069 RepID=A0A7H1B2G9_9ACTN|nr:LysR family transcriptional regulator [Streptomyces xanthii]QNS02924.1 LysR family transcriptional regulator [Streptomyces xanthii]